MPLTKAFYEAIRTKNVRRVRIMLKNSLVVDPSFSEYQSMIDIASNLEGLFDEHDGKIFNNEKSFWNDEYVSKEMARLISNFSKERIDHLKDVIRFLNPMNTNQQKHYGKSKSFPHQKRKIITGAVVGATIGALLGNVINDENGTVSVLFGVAGAIAGSVVVNCISNEDKGNE